MTTEHTELLKGLEQKVLQKREAMEKLSPATETHKDAAVHDQGAKDQAEIVDGKHGSREVPTYNIFVGDLAPDCNAEDLRNAFQNCGPVHSCDVIRDRDTGLSKRFGFVNFLSEDGQQNALGPDYTDIVIKGHRVRVNVSDSKATLYIGNLPRHLAANEVRSALEALAGPIVNLKLKEGYGFVTYVNAKRCVEASQRLQNQQIEGHPLIVQFPKDPKTKNLAKASDPFAAGKFTTPLSLYVNGLALTVSDSVLRSHFSKFGNVIRAVVVKNPEGKSRGFGFVEFDHPNSCETAVNCCDSTQLHGQSIHVAFARNKAPSDSPDWRGVDPYGSDSAAQLGSFHLDGQPVKQEAVNQSSPNPALVSSRRLSMGEQPGLPSAPVVPTTFGAHIAANVAAVANANAQAQAQQPGMTSSHYETALNYLTAATGAPYGMMTMSPSMPTHALSAAVASPVAPAGHLSVPAGYSVSSPPQLFMTRSLNQDSMVTYQASPQHPPVFINRIRIPPVPGNILSVQSPNITPTSLSSASPMMSTPGASPPKAYRRISSLSSSPSAAMGGVHGETPFSRTPSETPVFSRAMSPDSMVGVRSMMSQVVIQNGEDGRSGATTPEVDCLGPVSIGSTATPALSGISEADSDSMMESATSSATAAAMAAQTAAAIMHQQQLEAFQQQHANANATMVTSLDAYGRPVQTIQLASPLGSPMGSPTMSYGSLNFNGGSPFQQSSGSSFFQLPNGSWALGSPTIMGGQTSLGQVNGLNVVGVPVAVPVMVPTPYNSARNMQAPIVGLRKPSVYIGNLPLNMTASQLQPIFESMVGPFQQLHLKKGYCFLSFQDHSEAAAAAAALNNRTIEGRRLNAQIARERLAFMYPRHMYANLPSDGSIHFPASASFQQAQAEDRTLYVGNIPPHVTEAALSDHFSVYGDVVRAIVSVDPCTGLSRGYGFIEYKTKEPCEKAVTHLGGTDFEGSIITVRLSDKLMKSDKFEKDECFKEVARTAVPVADK